MSSDAEATIPIGSIDGPGGVLARRWYFDAVLVEAEIEIVNDAGQVEDRVRVVGTGGERGRQ